MRTDGRAGSSTSKRAHIETRGGGKVETAGMVLAAVEKYAVERRTFASPVQVGWVATSVLIGGFTQLLVDWLAGQVPLSRAESVEDATSLFVAPADSATTIAA